jgi:hypothetical protein
MLKSSIKRLRPTHVIALLALVLALGGTATAATFITGKDVRDGSLTGADIKDGSVKSDSLADGSINSTKLSDGVWTKLQRADVGTSGANGADGATGAAGAKGDAGAAGADGATGATGATGDKGDAGDAGATGDQGTPGQALVVDESTPANPSYAGKGLAVVGSVARTDPGPAIDGGTAILDPVQLPEGRYLMQLTAQFFDFEQDGDGAAYPVIKSFLGSDDVATGWGSDIPDNDPNNASQGSGTQVIDVPAGGATLTTRAEVRGGSGTYQGGATLIVTALG